MKTDFNMPWVSGHLTGGLGNRLFQHAASAGLAEQWGHECVLYKPGMETTNHAEVDRIYDLFPQVRVVETTESYQMAPEPPGACFTYLGWPERAPPGVGNVLVDGWRQTEKYFPRNGIHVDLEHAVGSARLESLLRQYDLDTDYSRRNTWSVHFRFGDYLQLPHHQIDLGSYYGQAIRQIPASARILIFSDEAVRFKSVLQGLFAHRRQDITIVAEEGVIDTLALMAYCWGGSIVANSTFSWWGAYCAHRRAGQNHKALFPRIWGKGLPPARDVVPSWGSIIENVC